MARTAAATLLLLSLLAVAFAAAEAVARPVAGGRTAIKDPAKNKEVQALGKYAVDEHNSRLANGGAATADDPVTVRLTFKRVATAEVQVVAGMKYYLKVIARDYGGGGYRRFDAEVVVQAWMEPNKKLLSFKPSPK